MDVLTILFAGLITHVLTDSGTQRAVLIAAPGHVARLTIAAADVIDAHGVTEQPATNLRERVFLLNGEHVTLEGIEKGAAVFDASYMRHVPSVTRISDGTTLIAEIERGEAHPAVAAYVDLGAGRFSVSEVSPQEVSFDVRGMRHVCLAHIVAFRAPAIAEAVEIRMSKGSIRVRPNATLRIENDPMPDVPGSHFHMYANILADATYVNEPIPTGRFCDGDIRAGRRLIANSVTGPDCSNTNYP
jgi:hypothetical protein